MQAKDIPIVFLSSHTEAAIVEKTEKITSYGYVVKNTGIIVLDASIKMAIKLFVAKTEEKRAKQALNYQRATYEQILEQSLAGYWDWDIPSGDEYLSPTFKRMFGYEDHEIENRAKSWQSLIYQEDLPGVLDKYNQHIASRGTIPFYNEVRYHHKDCSTVWVICTGRVVEWDEEGNAQRMIGCHIDITQRKQTEEALRESEGRFKALHDASFGGIAIHDKGVILECNQGMSDMTGYSLAELIGMDGLLLIAEKSRKEVMKNIQSGYEKPYEAFGLRKNGDEYPLRLEAQNVRYKGKLVRTVEFRDVAELKEAEEDLREQLAFRSALLDAIPAPVFFKDSEGVYLGVNQAFEEFFGKAKSEIVGKTVFDISPQELAEIYHAQDLALFAEGGVQVYEAQVKDARGRIHEVIFNKAAFSHADGSCGGLIGVILDITQRKQVEETLNEIIEKNPLSIQVLDEDGLTLKVNPAFRELFGFSPPPDFSVFTHMQETGYGEDVRRAKNGEIVQSPDIYYNARDNFPELPDKPIWMRAILFPLKNPDIIGQFVIIREDITQRKLAEDEIHKQLAEKELLLREVHHRVKNNINNIENLLFLQADAANNLEAKTALQACITRINGTRVLYDKLLLSGNYQEISFKSYVESLLDSITAVYDIGGNVTIKRQITDFTIDAKKVIPIGIIINELMTNAFKYAVTDSDGGSVAISFEKNGQDATLVIEDNGRGCDAIPGEDAGAGGCSGMGLTIVKMLVEQMQGTFTVESEKGTKNVIRFKI